MIGKVGYVNYKKKYFFLIKSDGKELFGHFSEIQDFARLETGQMVRYENGTYCGRPCAVTVSLIEGTDTSAPAVTQERTNVAD